MPISFATYLTIQFVTKHKTDKTENSHGCPKYEKTPQKTLIFHIRNLQRLMVVFFKTFL